jgi:hypothetical protein
MTTGEISQNIRNAALPGEREFDFWLGVWDVAWREGGKGTNTITSILDGRVIQENFDGSPGTLLRGMSVSVHENGVWKQTWVDNNGSYLDFVGEFHDGKMDLRRRAALDGKPIIQRMVWYNIAQDELDWNWERSDDEGKTWTVLWQIHYRRRP